MRVRAIFTPLAAAAVLLIAGCASPSSWLPATGDARLALVAVSRLPAELTSARVTLLGAELVPRGPDMPGVALLPAGARARTLDLAWASDGVTARLLDGAVPPGQYRGLLLTLRGDAPGDAPRRIGVLFDRPFEARPGFRTTMVVEFDLTGNGMALAGAADLVAVELERTESRVAAPGRGLG